MNRVTVKASKKYEVQIGSGLFETIGSKAAELVKGRNCAIIMDEIVSWYFTEAVGYPLAEAGFEVYPYIFPHGEESKCGSVYLNILDFLADNHFTRSDLIVALGGGVAGDLAGFAAATYMRGISLIQVPTTLLAMVDSSVGGKTAIDLPSGKNLCGAFYQPSLVMCDVDALKNLPDSYFTDGCAEVIKYGVLGDRDLFDTLKAGKDVQNWEDVITKCVSMKRDVVEEDEFDNARRQFLNLGHTLGHAIEANSNYGLAHGKCVAIGMAMIARAAAKLGFCSAQTRDEIVGILTAYGLPISTDQTAEDIFEAAKSDKKRRGGTISLVVPHAIGSCEIHKIDVDELPKWIEAGM